MIFSNRQIEEILKIIDFQHALFVVGNISPNVLSESDLLILKSFGVNINDFNATFTPFQQAFYFGRLAAALRGQTVNVEYADFKKYIQRGQYNPLSNRERKTLQYLEENTYNFITKQRESIKSQIQNELNFTNIQDTFGELVNEELKTGLKERRTIKEVISSIGNKSQKWNKDLGRIVETEMQNAYLYGKGFDIVEKYGAENVKFFKRVNPMACFPTVDTEFLTNEGFKFLKDIRGDEQVATYNLETNTLEYTFIRNKIQYHYEGEMNSYNHKSLDLIVTPNHKMLVSLKLKQNKRECIKNMLIESQDVIKKKTYFMRYTVDNWVGSDIDIIYIAGKEFSTNLFVQFLGWYLSEGHCTKRGKDSKGRFFSSSVKISQNKDKYLEEIKQCLTLLFNKTCNYNSGQFGISLDKSYDDFIDWLKSLGDKAWTKRIPNEIKSLSKSFLLTFLDSYLKGGNYHRYHGIKFIGKKQTSLITSSSIMRDDICEILLKCGLRMSSQTLDNRGRVTYDKRGVRFETKRLTYVINILVRKNFSSIYRHFKKIENWRGEVGCLEVEKNNTLFIRRNGTYIWSGNCKYCIAAYLTNGIGSEPRLFTMTQLLNNGTNIGLKANEWKPVLSVHHPFCRCDLDYISTMEEWDSKNKEFKLKEKYSEEARAIEGKIVVKVGDKIFDI